MAGDDGKETNEDNKSGEEDDSGASLADKADKAADRLEAANEKAETILNREEDLYAKKKLGGESTAGQEVKEEVVSKEEKGKRLAAKFDTGDFDFLEK